MGCRVRPRRDEADDRSDVVAACLVRLAPALLAPLVLFLILRHRHRIDAGEPAVEIDIAATSRAERPEPLGGGLTADRAGLRRDLALPRIGHGRNMGRRRTRASSYGVEPAEMDGIAFAAEERHRLVERQADHVRVGADDLDDEGRSDALRGVAAGLAAPFAGSEIG